MPRYGYNTISSTSFIRVSCFPNSDYMLCIQLDFNDGIHIQVFILFSSERDEAKLWRGLFFIGSPTFRQARFRGATRRSSNLKLWEKGAHENHGVQTVQITAAKHKEILIHLALFQTVKSTISRPGSRKTSLPSLYRVVKY